MRIPSETPASENSASHAAEFNRHLRSRPGQQNTPPSNPSGPHGQMPLPDGGGGWHGGSQPNGGGGWHGGAWPQGGGGWHGWPSPQGGSGWHGWPSPQGGSGWHGWPSPQGGSGWHGWPSPQGGSGWHGWPSPQGGSGWHGWPSPQGGSGWHGWPSPQGGSGWHGSPVARAPDDGHGPFLNDAPRWGANSSALPDGDGRAPRSTTLQHDNSRSSASQSDPHRASLAPQMLGGEGHDYIGGQYSDAQDSPDNSAFAARQLAELNTGNPALMGGAAADELIEGNSRAGPSIGRGEIAPEPVWLRNDVPVWAIQGYGSWQQRQRSAAWWRRRRLLQLLRRIRRLSRRQR